MHPQYDLFKQWTSVTRTYGIMAMGIGVYLGVLYVLTGNLLAPMIAHAVYDAVFLIWSLKVRRRE
jgi:membrane protease YdiL (CAAX protease family)